MSPRHSPPAFRLTSPSPSNPPSSARQWLTPPVAEARKLSRSGERRGPCRDATPNHRASSSRRTATPEQKRDEREHEEYEEQDLRNTRGAGSEAAKTEDRCQKCDHEKYRCPIQHDSFPPCRNRATTMPIAAPVPVTLCSRDASKKG